MINNHYNAIIMTVIIINNYNIIMFTFIFHKIVS